MKALGKEKTMMKGAWEERKKSPVKYAPGSGVSELWMERKTGPLSDRTLLWRKEQEKWRLMTREMIVCE